MNQDFWILLATLLVVLVLAWIVLRPERKRVSRKP